MRTICAAILIGAVAAISAAMPAAAQDHGDKSADVYTVSGVAVDVTADSASAAREKAFDNAQRKAFETLLQRLVGADAMDQVTVPESQQLGSLVKNYGIDDEQVSKVRYKARYTFTFDKKGVRNFLSDRGIAYSETIAAPLLVLPFFQQGAQLNLWRGYNPWLDVWSDSPAPDGLLPLEVPIGDLSDLRRINGDNALTYNPQALQKMLDRYEAKEAVLLIAAFNEGPPPRSLDAPAYTPLTIYIYRTDNKAPQFVRSLYLRPERGAGLRNLLNRAMRDVADFLRKDWKAGTAVQPGQRETIEAVVRFDGLDQWQAMQERLRGLGGVDSLDIRELSANRARLALGYRGSMQQFSQTLRRDGLQANTFHPGRRSGYSSNGQSNPVMNIRKDIENRQKSSQPRRLRRDQQSRDQYRRNTQGLPNRDTNRNTRPDSRMQVPSRNTPQQPNQQYRGNRAVPSGTNASNRSNTGSRGYGQGYSQGYSQGYQNNKRGY